MTISERIFKIMSERGMSQLEFSRRTGISQSTISDWKRKKTNPGADKIMVICEVLGVTPYEILSDISRESSPDCLYVSKGTDNYNFLIEIDSLNNQQKERLKGYLSAIIE